MAKSFPDQIANIFHIFKWISLAISTFAIIEKNSFRKGDFAFISGVVSLVDQEFNDLENEMASSKETPMIKTPRLKIVIVPCPRTSGTFSIFQNINFKINIICFMQSQWPLSSGIFIICKLA